MQIAELFRFRHSRDNRSRPDRPADAQAGEGHLRIAAQKDRVLGAVELLERGDRASLIAQIAVGVVFNHDDAGRTRQTKESFSRVQRERRPRWILEIGGDDERLGTVSLQGALEIVEVDSIRAHPHAHCARPGGSEKILHARIDRIFESHRVAGPNQDPL